jgi:hypothetical protein
MLHLLEKRNAGNSYRGLHMEVGIHIPDDIAEHIRQSQGQNIARYILEAYAIRAYQERTLGESQLRRLLGFETRDELGNFWRCIMSTVTIPWKTCSGIATLSARWACNARRRG